MWYNPIITALLRSPLHFFVSGLYVLVTFTGKKSGKTYTTPVQYKQTGQALEFVTRKSRRWWRNLRGGAPVTVRLRGHDLAAHAEVPDFSPAALAAEIHTIYAPMLSAEQAGRLAPESVVVRIDLGHPN
jgi:hypothetical protein